MIHITEEEPQKKAVEEQQTEEVQQEEPQPTPAPHELTLEEIKKKVEAIFFAAGRTVDLEELCNLLGVTSQGLVKEAIKELKQELEAKNSSTVLIGEDNKWKLTVRDKYAELVKEVTPHTEIDKAILETLAVIAWRQPVLQAEVVKIRTSQAYEHIAQLVEMGFISKEKYGRSYILKPTQKFLEYFDLPSKEAVKKLFKDVPSLVEQKRLSEQEGAEGGEEQPDKVGDLEVYEEPEQQEQSAEETQEDAEQKVKVYGEEAQESEQEEQTEQPQEEVEEQKATEEQEEAEPIEEVKEETEQEEHKENEEDTPEERELPASLEDFAKEEEDEDKETEEHKEEYKEENKEEQED